MAEHPNATLIRRGYAAFSAGDVEALTELLADDAVQHMRGHNVFSGDHTGRGAILSLATRSDSTLRVTLEEVHANDDEVVTVCDKHLDTRHALVFRLREGKAVDLLDEASDDTFWA